MQHRFAIRQMINVRPATANKAYPREAAPCLEKTVVKTQLTQAIGRSDLLESRADIPEPSTIPDRKSD